MLIICRVFSFKVADELAAKWTNMLDEPKIPLGQYTSLYAVKLVLRTLFGNLLKDYKDEMDFKRRTDEVRAIFLSNVSIYYCNLISFPNLFFLYFQIIG